MSARSIGLLAFSTIVAVSAGCRLNSFSMSAYDNDSDAHFEYEQHSSHSKPVYLRRSHVCGHDCNDHYWNGFSLVALRNSHHHGSSCGHRWSGSRWVAGHGKGRSHHYRRAKFKNSKKHKKGKHSWK